MPDKSGWTPAGGIAENEPDTSGNTVVVLRAAGHPAPEARGRARRGELRQCGAARSL